MNGPTTAAFIINAFHFGMLFGLNLPRWLDRWAERRES